MSERKIYRVTGVHDGHVFKADAMVFEETEREIGLTYLTPGKERRADWFWRDTGLRHADHGDVPYTMELVEQT